jgi:hypothetical protein
MPRFCDRVVEREIRRGLTLQQTDPSAANDVWAASRPDDHICFKTR